MTDDLIARLRDNGLGYSKGYVLCQEAADALEKQAKIIAELEKLVKALTASINRTEPKVTLALELQEARIAELTAALKELADEYAPRAFYGEADDAVQKARAALGEKE